MSRLIRREKKNLVCTKQEDEVKKKAVYQVSEANKPNIIKWSKRPPGDEVSVKVMEET
jgi:hypothetical protein